MSRYQGKWFKKVVSAVVLGMLLTACGGNPPATKPQGQGLYKPHVRDNAPRTSSTDLARLAVLPDPVVVSEPRSRWGNGPIYTVLGKRYKVLESGTGYTETGIASWYGTKFHGRRTSNGERFDIYKLTAAHKHLPLPSFVRVTNLGNGKQTVVRVNDRGPFHDDRVIDLSYAAAVKLGFHDKGTARVRIEVLEPVQQPRSYLVQAGAFSEFSGASRSQDRLTAMTGIKAIIVKTAADALYRVQLGPLTDPAQLARVKALLEASDFGSPRIIEVR